MRISHKPTKSECTTEKNRKECHKIFIFKSLKISGTCKIVLFNSRRLKLWKRVFDKVNFNTKQKQISLHRHFNIFSLGNNILKGEQSLICVITKLREINKLSQLNSDKSHTTVTLRALRRCSFTLIYVCFTLWLPSLLFLTICRAV